MGAQCRITLQNPSEPYWEAREIWRGGLDEGAGYMAAIVATDTPHHWIKHAMTHPSYFGACSYSASAPGGGMYRMEYVK